MTKVSYKEISEEESGQRIDNYLLCHLKGVPKSHIYRIIRSGEVRANKKRVRPDYRIQSGDVIRIPPVRLAEKSVLDWNGLQAGQRLLQTILYEDERLMVINKPSGIAVHGGSGLSFGVIEALRQVRKDLHYLELVHRIDRETSGCLVLAKKRSALRAIHRLLENRQVEKIYSALLYGRWHGRKHIRIEAALEKNQLQSGERMVRVSSEGKPACTDLYLVENYSHACMIEARPHTGRTHQIRVHCASIGQAIIFDDKYASNAQIDSLKQLPPRLYLHASGIRFTLGDRNYQFEAPLDGKFMSAIQYLKSGS